MSKYSLVAQRFNVGKKTSRPDMAILRTYKLQVEITIEEVTEVKLNGEDMGVLDNEKNAAIWFFFY